MMCLCCCVLLGGVVLRVLCADSQKKPSPATTTNTHTNKQLLLLTAAFIAVLLSIVALRPMALRPLHTAQLGANGVLCLTSFVMLSFLQLDRDTGDAYREAMGALLLAANLLWVLWALFAIVE